MIRRVTAAAILVVVAAALWVPTVFKLLIVGHHSLSWWWPWFLAAGGVLTAAALMVLWIPTAWGIALGRVIRGLWPEWNGFQTWNYDVGLAGWRTFLSLTIGVVVWIGLSWVFWKTPVPAGYWGPLSIKHIYGGAVAYGWVSVVGAGLVTSLFVEINRSLFSWGILLPKWVKPQPRFGPRIEPVATGIMERLLFTTIAILLIGNNQINGLVVASTGYIGLKAVKRWQAMAQEETVLASVHSIWGSTVSLAFAAGAGWLFKLKVF